VPTGVALAGVGAAPTNRTVVPGVYPKRWASAVLTATSAVSWGGPDPVFASHARAAASTPCAGG